MRFGQNLEAIAKAGYQSSRIGKLLHCAHHGREPRDGTAAQVVSIRETTRENDGVKAVQVLTVMPDKICLLPEIASDGVVRVVIAIRAGKHYDSELHWGNLSVTERAAFRAAQSYRNFEL